MSASERAGQIFMVVFCLLTFGMYGVAWIAFIEIMIDKLGWFS